jgi:type I restriction enzyme R subunit
MSGNFDFLSKEFPALATFGNQAESYCKDDSNSALIKVGMIGESIVGMIYSFTGVEEPADQKAVMKINRLASEGYLPQQIVSVLHEMRKARNRAVHDGYESVQLASDLVRIAYSVCLWFAMAFGREQYKMRPYAEPVDDKSGTASDVPKKTSDAEDEKLAKEAKKQAKVAPKVTKAERVKRVLEAENQRPKTEKETRLLVDAAMRDAGWEADTETIRHSKGARPKKGHNMAIAEWPTDSSIGDGAYVDYAFFVDETMVGTVEAKAERKDVLSVLDVQCKDYSSHIRQVDRKYITIEYDGRYQVPFTFATNGQPYLKQYETKSGIWSLDLRDPSNAPKPLRGWPRPQALMRMLQEDVKAANRRLADEPYDLLRDKDGLNLRDYQIKAVAAAEQAVIAGKPSALIAMATGTGKTRTALATIYRFLATDRFRRILFLVDRDALGEQAEDAFRDVKIEQLMALDKIYEVKGLDSAEINPETRISIATVQSMVKRIMYDDGEGNKPAVTDFDLVIVDAVTVYNPKTGELINGEELEDELDFDVDDFNKSVVDENVDRAILEEIVAYMGSFREHGGRKKLDKVFHGELVDIVHELNTYLYDDKGHAA